MKKLYQNTLILSISNVLVRVIGLFFLIYLSTVATEESIGIYTYAFIPYMFFSDITTLGISLASSRYISLLVANKEDKKIGYFYNECKKYLLILGIFSFVLLNVIAIKYSKIELGGITDNKVITNIRIISLALIVTPLLSFYRGVCNGYLDMRSNSISLIIEQVIRVFLSIILFNVIPIKNDYYLIYIVMICNVVGVFISNLYLKFNVKNKIPKIIYKYPFKKKFIKTIVLLGILTINLSIYQMIDSITYMSNDKSVLKAIYYKIYNFEVQRLIIIPIIISSCLATSLLPSISFSKREEITKSIKNVLNISYYFIIFCCGFFYLYRIDVYSLFYEESLIGYNILKNSVLLIFSFSIYKILIGINQGIGKINLLCIVSIISFLLKYTLNVILIKQYSYNGLIISSFLSCFLMVLCSIYLIKKYLNIGYLFHLFKIIKSLISITISYLITYGIKKLYIINLDNYFKKLVNIAVEGSIFFICSLLIYLLFNQKKQQP